jgi:4a-hydroxytetrahydrobiopterin dehydratase
MALLSDSELADRLAERPQWAATDGAIARELTFPDFAAAIAFVDRVAEVAEAANHHPDIFIHGWNKVRLTLSTHSQGGLTDADFRLAAEVDGLA